MSTAKKRKAITIQLNPNTDSDLIAKIEALPGGERNSALKKILRRGFQPDDQSNLQAALIAGFEWLGEEIAGVRSAIEGATLVSHSNDAPLVEVEPAMDEAERQERESNIGRNSWDFS